ncbi:MAG: sugar phosphate nucleotidyltransferase [Bacteroidota bacterium]
MANTDHLWGIVLAGGEGKRLQEFIRKRYGAERPKQYSAIIGKRSMLRHTLDRVEKIIPPKQLQIVVSRKHRKYLPEVLKEREKKAVLVAPENRESAASVYLALSHIYFRDPDAVVAIFPSDHFIGEEERFLFYVERAISFIGEHPDHVVLLGIKPTDANPEYGWIEPNKNFLLHEGNRFYKVISFREKPNLEEAQKLFDKGCLWNSLVLAARCETLVKMYRQQLKVIYDAFKKGKSVYGTDEEESFIVDAFENIPSRSFSKCVLEVIPESLFVLRVEGILWSDWGTKEQVLKDLDSLGVAH